MAGKKCFLVLVMKLQRFAVPFAVTREAINRAPFDPLHRAAEIGTNIMPRF